MVIPQLNRPSHKSGQDWRHPVYVKNKRVNWKSAVKKSADNFRSFSRLPKRHKKLVLKKFLSVLIPIAVFFILLFGIFALAGLAWISKDLPSPDKVINRELTVSTKIYDRTGTTVLYDIHGNIKRTVIELSDIPPQTINATLAAEDRNFYQHKGFSITGIVRSALLNVFTGSRVGGSTLTQQFVKNAILTNEKTYSRKIKEFFLAYRIERKFSKDEILKMYFNEIPYGSVIYGIEAASESFFGKSAKDLTIAESAILAAIPKAPTYYSPYGNNRDRLIARQRYILDSMADLGYISKGQADMAKQEKINFKLSKESMIAPHFVMYIKELLSEKYGEAFIAQEGLKVLTSLDLDKQKIAEEAVAAGVEANAEKYGFTNASLVAIDPKTGQILAMVGSADYFNEDIDGQVNVALRPRQPGSSFKPMVYTASFIKGYTPDTIIYDTVTNFDATGAKKYEPHNYDDKERGPVTIRKALAGSLNIPAVKITYLTGVENVLDLADELGYTTLKDRDRFGLSLVLGGGEVKLLEHTNAYAVLAQEGERHDINPILKIEDKNGRILYEYKDKKEKVLEPEIARITTDILSDDNARAYAFGAGSKLTLPDRPVAAKTGTTNDYRDAWTIGYVPSLAAGVWVGNNNNDEMARGSGGSKVAAPIWNQFMREALKDTPVESFVKPELITTDKPILDGIDTGEVKIKIDTMSGKLATKYTPESTTKEISTKEIHSILYYINKDDPRGDPPINPSGDPQFDSWENSVLRWAEEQGYDPNQDVAVPTKYDDIHLAEDQPNLIIITPLPNQTVSDSSLVVEVTANSKRGIKKIEYYLNGSLVLTKNDDSDAVLSLSELENGYHTLKVKAKDDLENTSVKTVEINFIGSQVATPVLNWVSPGSGSVLSFPASFKASLINGARIKKIDFYFQKIGANEQFLISLGSVADISFIWSGKPSPGEYAVYGNMFDGKNRKYITEKLRVKVE